MVNISDLHRLADDGAPTAADECPGESTGLPIGPIPGTSGPGEGEWDASRCVSGYCAERAAAGDSWFAGREKILRWFGWVGISPEESGLRYLSAGQLAYLRDRIKLLCG